MGNINELNSKQIEKSTESEISVNSRGKIEALLDSLSGALEGIASSSKYLILYTLMMTLATISSDTLSKGDQSFFSPDLALAGDLSSGNISGASSSLTQKPKAGDPIQTIIDNSDDFPGDIDELKEINVDEKSEADQESIFNSGVLGDFSLKSLRDSISETFDFLGESDSSDKQNDPNSELKKSGTNTIKLGFQYRDESDNDGIDANSFRFGPWLDHANQGYQVENAFKIMTALGGVYKLELGDMSLADKVKFYERSVYRPVERAFENSSNLSELRAALSQEFQNIPEDWARLAASAEVVEGLGYYASDPDADTTKFDVGDDPDIPESMKGILEDFGFKDLGEISITNKGKESYGALLGRDSQDNIFIIDGGNMYLARDLIEALEILEDKNESVVMYHEITDQDGRVIGRISTPLGDWIRGKFTLPDSFENYMAGKKLPEGMEIEITGVNLDTVELDAHATRNLNGGLQATAEIAREEVRDKECVLISGALIKEIEGKADGNVFVKLSAANIEFPSGGDTDVYGITAGGQIGKKFHIDQGADFIRGTDLTVGGEFKLSAKSQSGINEVYPDASWGMRLDKDVTPDTSWHVGITQRLDAASGIGDSTLEKVFGDRNIGFEGYGGVDLSREDGSELGIEFSAGTIPSSNGVSFTEMGINYKDPDSTFKLGTSFRNESGKGFYPNRNEIALSADLLKVADNISEIIGTDIRVGIGVIINRSSGIDDNRFTISAGTNF